MATGPGAGTMVGVVEVFPASDGLNETPFAHGCELDVLGDLRLAAGVVVMLSSMPDWVHRRVEQLEILDEMTARRRVSLDLTVPNPAISSCKWMDGMDRVLLPLELLAKEPLRRFSIVDSGGRPVSHRSADE